jgi:hypothetical protein
MQQKLCTADLRAKCLELELIDIRYQATIREAELKSAKEKLRALVSEKEGLHFSS